MQAINNESELLIMDEPSAVLTERELDTMFNIIKQLREGHYHHLYFSPS